MPAFRILLASALLAACASGSERPTVSTSTRQQVQRAAASVAATRHERAPLFEPGIAGNALPSYRALHEVAAELDHTGFPIDRKLVDPAHWGRAPTAVRELAGSLRVRAAADAAVLGARHTFVSDPKRFDNRVVRQDARLLLSLAANDAFESGDTGRAIDYAITSLRLGDDLTRIRSSFHGIVHREIDEAVLDQIETFAARGNLSERALRRAIGGLQRIIDTQPELLAVLRHDATRMNLSFIESADEGRSPRDDVGELNQRVYDELGVNGLIDGIDDLLGRWERDLTRLDDPERAIHINCARELRTRRCELLSELPADLAASRALHESTYLLLARQLAHRSPTAVAEVLARHGAQQTK